MNYWKELSKYVEKQKYIILVIIFVCQMGFFIILKFYFFAKLSGTVNGNEVNDLGNYTNFNNTYNNTNLNTTNLNSTSP